MCAVEIQPSGARGNSEEFPKAFVVFFLPAAHPTSHKVILRILGRVHKKLVTMELSRNAKQIFHYVFP